MAYKPTKKIVAKPKTSIGRIGGAVFLVVAAIVMPVIAANMMADNAMVDLVGRDVIYRLKGVRPTLTGFKASNVEIRTNGAPISIGEMSVDGGFVWMLQSAYAWPFYEPTPKRLLITYDDIKNPDGYSIASAYELPVGSVSAIPFEAQGCGAEAYFDETDTEKMGLKRGKTKITHEYVTQVNELLITESIETENLGRALIATTAEIQGGTRQWRLNADRPTSIRFLDETWKFEDLGFVKARNAFCADKLGMSVDSFLTAHIASVERLMQSEGLTTSVPVWQMYIDFARNGGVLSANGKYGMELTSTNYYDTSWRDQFKDFKGEAQRGDQRITLGFGKRDPIPFDDADEIKTTYEVLMKEGGISPSSDIEQIVGRASTEASGADQAASETVVVQGVGAPELISQIQVIEREEIDYITSFAGLSSVRGKRVRIERTSGDVIIGEVLGMNKDGVQLKVFKSGGYAELNLPSTGFRRASVLRQ